MLAGLSVGCQDVKVTVDCRLAPGGDARRQLADGTYLIQGHDDEQEASLAFQDYADLLGQALQLTRPDMQRATDPSAEADLHLSLGYNVYDRGTGVATYPVYSHGFGHPYFHGGYGYGYGGYRVVGTRVESVHLGYTHQLFITAWQPDPGQPAERQVLWEGYAEMITERRSLKATMPYLMAGLVAFFGEATEDALRIRIDDDDAVIEALTSPPSPSTRPE